MMEMEAWAAQVPPNKAVKAVAKIAQSQGGKLREPPSAS